MRSPSGDLVDSTATPFFLPKTERKPRMECGCQEVAFSSSCKVAPLGRFTRSRILAVLLPGRALPAFRRGWAPLLGRPGLACRRGLGGRSVAFLCGGSGFVGWFRLPSGRGLGRFSIFRCGYRHDACSFGGDYRRHDMDHSEALALQEKSLEIRKRRWNGDASWKTGTQLTLRDEPESLPRPINRLGPRASTVPGSG